MRRKLVLLAGATCVAFLAAAAARAENRTGGGAAAASPGDQPAPPRPAPRAPSRPKTVYAPDAAKTAARSAPAIREERKVLRAIAAASLLGTRAGKLALAKSSSPEVRAFAAGLIRHHEESHVEMLHLLHARDMAMPMLDNAQSQLLRRLEKASGKNFDREFLHAVGVESLRRDLRTLEGASQSVQDPALKAWVERSLPSLRLQLAVAERTGGSGTRTATGARSGTGAASYGQVTPVGARLNGSSSR